MIEEDRAAGLSSGGRRKLEGLRRGKREWRALGAGSLAEEGDKRRVTANGTRRNPSSGVWCPPPRGNTHRDSRGSGDPGMAGGRGRAIKAAWEAHLNINSSGKLLD